MSLLDRCGPSGRGFEQLDESPFCQKLAASLWMDDSCPPRNQYERMGARVLESNYFRPLHRELYDLARSLTFELQSMRGACGQGAPRYSESNGRPYFSRFDEPRYRGNPWSMDGSNYYGKSEDARSSYYNRRENPALVNTRDYSLTFTQDDMDKYFYTDGNQTVPQETNRGNGGVQQDLGSTAGEIRRKPQQFETTEGNPDAPIDETDPLSGLEEVTDFDPEGITPVKYSPGADGAKPIGSRPRDTSRETGVARDVSDGPIPWHRDTLTAYKEALSVNKPLVVVFGEQGSTWFVDQMAEMRKPEMKDIADQAVWLEGVPSRDRAAEAIAKALELKEYPTISILAPNPNKITETMRFEGYFPVNELRAPLRKAIETVPIDKRSESQVIMA